VLLISKRYVLLTFSLSSPIEQVIRGGKWKLTEFSHVSF